MEKEKSIYACYEEIKQREISELKDAVTAHGGKYEFGIDGPFINVNYDDGPEDVTVGRVEIQHIGDTEIVVIYDTTGEHIKNDDIAYGNIEFITKSIPKKKKKEWSGDTLLLCEAVSELSNLLYGPLYLKLQDSFEVDQEIVRLAVAFEESFDSDDFLGEIDKYAREYFKTISS